MPRFLLAWELGQGLGHLLPMRVIAEQLVRRNHEVTVVVRDVVQAGEVFGELPVRLLPAPQRVARDINRFDPLLGYAHILHNVGFGNRNMLRSLAGSWRALLELARPEVVLFDHSPTALLASQGLPLRRAILDPGFHRPPAEFPLRPLRPDANPEQLAREEERIRAHANHVLGEWGQARLDRMADLYYRQVHEHLLTTYPPLDHFGPRVGAEYLGPIPTDERAEPVWPEGEGPRVFAYLKPFASLEALLRRLRETGVPTLVAGDGIEREVRDRWSCSTLRFSEGPVGIRAAAERCHLAITNGGASTSARLLAVGRPLLVIPLNLEQSMIGRKVQDLGAGVLALPRHEQRIVEAVDSLLHGSSRYRDGAARFAQQHGFIDPQWSLGRIVERLEALVQ